MINIEFIEELDEDTYKILDDEFNKYAIKNNVKCNYKPFSYVAKENNNIVGIITGHSYYKEVFISDLIVKEEYRNKHLGTELVNNVLKDFNGKGLDNINLTTYEFQALEFYKKCGFKIEFVRKNKENPKLNKYYLVKYFGR